MDNKKNVPLVTSLALVGSLVLGAGTARAEGPCAALPSHATLASALATARAAENGGFDLDMWATVVNRDGVVCGVAFTGGDRGDQWPGSRVISAQKANTANAFSLPGLALSTANLYSAVQPGGSLFGLQESNPVNTGVAYGGNPSTYGQANDAMVNGKIGGVNVFGGGLGLYNFNGVLVGGIGVSGDTSCADHNIAWRTRHILNLDVVPAGVAAIFAGDATHEDNIIFDITPQPEQMPGVSATGFGHPHCGPGTPAGETALAAGLPATQ